MPSSIPTQFPQDREVWENLQRAIAQSSGFQRWRLEQQFENARQAPNLETLVRRYLRETLETLAY
ncbi:hypothetical protein [Lusitaniella coriacea]|uniref:hypothetical protein n=1 Tax=Lusitaniella coriacea TaxID=1983105 RepID=UPI003CFB74C8